MARRITAQLKHAAGSRSDAAICSARAIQLSLAVGPAGQSDQVISVEGLRVSVEGLEALDRSPVLGIKPLIVGFLPREEVREPAWAREIMARYW